jgi:hypothetical protein
MMMTRSAAFVNIRDEILMMIETLTVTGHPRQNPR